MRWDASGPTTLSKPEATFEVSEKGARCAAWSPHDAEEIAVGTEEKLQILDGRGPVSGLTILQPHDGATLDVDYNPNKPSAIATAGDDGRVKFWDLRQPSAPLKILRTGSHWCTRVQYNRFHDQLAVTSNADKNVKLWRVSSISSAPLLELGGDDPEDDSVMSESDDEHAYQDNNKPQAQAADVEVKGNFDLHDDAVYGLSWSAADAWIFASLSIDGRLVLNHVPSPEKYKILL